MIEFKNVCKFYPKNTHPALNNINLQIKDGEFVFIVGASGAGKTTLTRLLLREEKVSSGTLHINKYKLERMREFRIPYFRRRLGVVFQDFKLLENKTVYENVAFALEIVGVPKRHIKERVQYFLALVDLADKKNSLPNELSGGEQQRVCLARALINKPDLIIADEPTGNLDPVLSYDIMNLLVRINEVTNRTVIVITHEISLVKHFKKRVITLKDGCLINDDPDGSMLREREEDDENGGSLK